MKKILSAILVLTLIFAMTSCFDDDFEESEIVNPIVECKTAAELMDATEIDLDAPAGASDVKYSYIDLGSGGPSSVPIAQVDFTLDDNQYSYRAKLTKATTLYSAVENDMDAEQEELSEMMEDTIEECGEFAGLYDEWSSCASVDIDKKREGIVAFNKGKSGFIAWLDTTAGVLYSLSMTEKCTQNLLMTTAEKSFVPMHREAK